MTIHAERDTNVSEKATILNGIDICPPKWRVYGRGLNRSVHEGMKDNSNVKFHLKTRSGNDLILILI